LTSYPNFSPWPIFRPYSYFDPSSDFSDLGPKYRSFFILSTLLGNLSRSRPSLFGPEFSSDNSGDGPKSLQKRAKLGTNTFSDLTPSSDSQIIHLSLYSFSDHEAVIQSICSASLKQKTQNVIEYAKNLFRESALPLFCVQNVFDSNRFYQTDPSGYCGYLMLDQAQKRSQNHCDDTPCLNLKLEADRNYLIAFLEGLESTTESGKNSISSIIFYLQTSFSNVLTSESNLWFTSELLHSLSLSFPYALWTRVDQTHFSILETSVVPNTSGSFTFGQIQTIL
jgi:hypothetical protein